MYHPIILRILVPLSLLALAAEPLPLPLGPMPTPPAGGPGTPGMATLSPGSTYYSSGVPAVPPNLPSGQPPYAVGAVAPLGPAPLPGPGFAGVAVTPMPGMQQPPPPEPALPPPRLVPSTPPGPAGTPPPQVAPPPETATTLPNGSAPPQGPPLPVSMNLEELRQEITRLQTERRALAAERATLADALPGMRCGPAQESACTTAVQERVRALMEQLRQPAPQPRESEPAPLPPPRPAQQEKPVHPDQPAQPAPASTKPSPAAPPSPRDGSAGHPGHSVEKTDPPKKEHPAPPVDIRADAPIEPLGLAQALFQAGDYEGALKAYRILERSNPSAETLASIQYMMASCLRKLGKMDEAAALYREVASNDADDLIAETAQWQLSTMKSRRELDSQLEQLRQRRRSLLEKKQ